MTETKESAVEGAGIAPLAQSNTLSRAEVGAVAVVGLGYVGLPSALALARTGVKVTGVDIDPRVVATLQAGESPLRDSADDDEVRTLVEEGRLAATTSATEAAREADFVLVCVPTPVTHDHEPDLGPLVRASEAIGRGLKPGAVVSYESTTFPGCTERVCIPILERESGLRAGHDFGVAYCPERINPGDDAHRTESTPRVLGALDDRSLRIAQAVYASYLKAPLHLCPDIATAEAAKVLENVQRDVNIALVNEFAMLCPRLGLDARAVLTAARSKFNFVPVEPGPGVGGHCIPVDPWYLIAEARRVGFEPRLMATARATNERATDEVAEVILRETRNARGAKVALLGLAYKGGVGDVRESPALTILERLVASGMAVAVHDPYVDARTLARLPGVRPLPLEDAVGDAGVVAVLTDHAEFREIDWRLVAARARANALVVDARRVCEGSKLAAAGMRHWAIGRGYA